MLNTIVRPFLARLTRLSITQHALYASRPLVGYYLNVLLLLLLL